MNHPVENDWIETAKRLKEEGREQDFSDFIEDAEEEVYGFDATLSSDLLEQIRNILN